MSTAQKFVSLAEEAHSSLQGQNLIEVIADIEYRIDCDAMDIAVREDGSKTYRCYDGSCVNVNGTAVILAEEFA